VDFKSYTCERINN